MPWNRRTRTLDPPPERFCHCGSGKLPGIMRQDPHGWCCGDCQNDFKRCPGPKFPDVGKFHEGQTVRIREDRMAAFLRTCRGEDGRLSGAGGAIFPDPDCVYRPASVLELGKTVGRVLIGWGEQHREWAAAWVEVDMLEGVEIEPVEAPTSSQEPTFERTPIGDQAVIPGAVGRAMPRGGIRAKRRQSSDMGPLFEGPEPDQLGLLQ